MFKNLSYNNPQIARFLRRLAWERYVASNSISAKDAVSKYVQAIRFELGLEEYGDRLQSGGADDFLQKRYEQDIRKEGSELELKDKGWEGAWRLLYLNLNCQI